MQLDPDDSDSPVASIHHDVVGTLMCDHEEFGVLLRVALNHAWKVRGQSFVVANPILLMFLLSVEPLTPREIAGLTDRLEARGFVCRAAEGHHVPEATAIRIVEKTDLSASFLMQWNAAKVEWDQRVDA
nr:hypothetical protein OH826_20130 [Streptomyces sp. NBC_00899]